MDVSQRNMFTQRFLGGCEPRFDFPNHAAIHVLSWKVTLSIAIHAIDSASRKPDCISSNTKTCVSASTSWDMLSKRNEDAKKLQGELHQVQDRDLAPVPRQGDTPVAVVSFRGLRFRSKLTARRSEFFELAEPKQLRGKDWRKQGQDPDGNSQFVNTTLFLPILDAHKAATAAGQEVPVRSAWVSPEFRLLFSGRQPPQPPGLAPGQG